MPVNPQPQETEEEFISRCISHEIKKGTAADEKQGYAMCKSMWDNAQNLDKKYKKIKEFKQWISGS